jgi:hypothetical protein
MDTEPAGAAHAGVPLLTIDSIRIQVHRVVGENLFDLLRRGLVAGYMR